MGTVAMYRVIRGGATFLDHTGTSIELVAGDVVTAGRDSVELVAMEPDTQVLRLGLLDGMESLRRWTPGQRDDIDALAGEIVTQSAVRPLRAEGAGVGHLYP